MIKILEKVNVLPVQTLEVESEDSLSEIIKKRFFLNNSLFKNDFKERIKIFDLNKKDDNFFDLINFSIDNNKISNQEKFQKKTLVVSSDKNDSSIVLNEKLINNSDGTINKKNESIDFNKKPQCNEKFLDVSDLDFLNLKNRFSLDLNFKPSDKISKNLDSKNFSGEEYLDLKKLSQDKKNRFNESKSDQKDYKNTYFSVFNLIKDHERSFSEVNSNYLEKDGTSFEDIKMKIFNEIFSTFELLGFNYGEIKLKKNNEFNIHLFSENLGELKINVIANGVNIELEIESVSENAKIVLDKSIDELKKSFLRQKLILKNIVILSKDIDFKKNNNSLIDLKINTNLNIKKNEFNFNKINSIDNFSFFLDKDKKKFQLEINNTKNKKICNTIKTAENYFLIKTDNLKLSSLDFFLGEKVDIII